MIPIPAGVRVWLATGHTDMRKGFDGLALLMRSPLRPRKTNRWPQCGSRFYPPSRRWWLVPALAIFALAAVDLALETRVISTSLPWLGFPRRIGKRFREGRSVGAS